jgi:nucleotide-binding universal stress UspA family protein
METEFDFDDDEQPTQALDKNIRRQLREAEKASREVARLQAELEDQRREVLYAKVGIPETGVGALFRKADEGDMTVEAIRQRAESYGILQGSSSEQAAASVDPELAAYRRAQGATIGTSGSFPDPGEEFYAQLAEASSPEEVMKIVTGTSGQTLGLWSSRNAR